VTAPFGDGQQSPGYQTVPKGSASQKIRPQKTNVTPGKGRKDANTGNSSRATVIQQDGWNHFLMPTCGAKDTAESQESRKAYDVRSGNMNKWDQRN
jgi:hypothetical protein